MNISVAICTWNRAALLEQTLAEMRRLDIPVGVSWELLVVNNNCTDNTDAILSRQASHLPLRRLFEARPGQSHARNCAVTAAQGDFILWTDDDVLVAPNWLAAYWTALAQWPDTAFFGGRITPWFEGTPPAWLQQVWPQVAGAYAVRDLGADSVPFTPDQLPYGANFGVRTSLQRKYPYNPDLGLKPNGSMRGDEDTLLARMLHDGLQGRWLPDAQVRHYIPKARQTAAYLRHYWTGYGEFLAHTSPPETTARFFGKPRWLIRRTAVAYARYLQSRCGQPATDWIKNLQKFSIAWGRLRAAQRPE